MAGARVGGCGREGEPAS
uniref:Uncharacterized protein n=1 Tax=Arundo donax TaxID=35708 RepID=A0A0A9GTV2_ARUDO